jgi:hypothetical protein
MTVLVLANAVATFAQTPVGSRGFVVVNGGYQLTANDFEDATTFRANAEDGRLTTDYEVKGGPAFDVAGGARVWRQLAVSVGVARFSRSTPSAVSGTIPHPFFFNRLRSVDGEAAGLTREELAVHMQARVIVPVGARVQLMGFGGPSLFRVTQGVVRDITWTESYPYDVAAFGQAQTTNASGSKLGFNAGADVAFFFTERIGVGATVQVATATVQLSAAAGNARDMKVGGTKAGGGLRLRF